MVVSYDESGQPIGQLAGSIGAGAGSEGTGEFRGNRKFTVLKTSFSQFLVRSNLMVIIRVFCVLVDNIGTFAFIFKS